MISLRPYQKEAVDAVLGEWEKGRLKTLLVSATGTGKSRMATGVMERALGSRNKALFLAHRGELLTQAYKTITGLTSLNCDFEIADRYADIKKSDVVIGSVQTLCSDKRLSRYPRDLFSHIIVDEAHHTTSDSYLRILSHFEGSRILGLTATPSRADKKELSTFYDSIAYEYPLSRAIREGYLSRIKAEMIPLKLDITKVKVTNGDYNASDIGNALDPYLPLIADEMKEKCKGRKTVVFLPLIKTSLKFLEILTQKGMRAEEVNGQSPDRAEKLKRFEKGETDILLNSMILTEGWDCPCVDCVVILRPTKVRSLLQQMAGRGTRLYPGKKDLLLLDFLWLTERMDLCRPSSLFCSKREVQEKMDKKLESGEIIDLALAEEEAERDIVREREEALAEELRAMRQRKRRLVDPLQFAVSLDDEVLMNYEPTFAWEMEPASEKQIAYLENKGISASTIQNKGYATMVIDRLKRREGEKLTTPKQIRLLERYGFEKVGLWRFSEANALITRLAERKWVLPYNFVASAYRPKSLKEGV